MDSDQLSSTPEEKVLSFAEGWVLVLGIIFVAANLRAPLTSVGPLVGTIRDALGISNTLAGMITSLPLLAFAFLSPVAPKLARRLGTPRVLFFAMILLALGIALRSSLGVSTLLLGTVLLGLAISVCNVLMPSFVKEKYPYKIGMMTGIYSFSMNLSGAIASGISVPISVQMELGWSGALGIWALLALLTILFWIPQMRNRQAQPTAMNIKRTNLWKSSLAWQVTLFMGLQSLIIYTMYTWLPAILGEHGMSSEMAGWMLSALQLAMLPVSFMVPILAGRMNNQVILAIMTAGFFLTGIGGLFLGNGSLVVLWTILIGIGSGFAFSLAMMFFVLRTRTPMEAAELSGMAQTVGYLLAAVGPTLFGFLHDQTQGWTFPLLVLLLVAVLLLIVGLGSARNRYVGGTVREMDT